MTLRLNKTRGSDWETEVRHLQVLPVRLLSAECGAVRSRLSVEDVLSRELDAGGGEGRGRRSQETEKDRLVAS